ncbi:hypothetical protein KIPB_013484, partial [Kipferlia bialata]
VFTFVLHLLASPTARSPAVLAGFDLFWRHHTLFARSDTFVDQTTGLLTLLLGQGISLPASKLAHNSLILLGRLVSSKSIPANVVLNSGIT